MATWPSSLCPLVNSLQETPPNNSIRTTMDKGPDKVRRRTTANVRLISFKVFMLNENVSILDDFYNDTTYSGSETFTFTHPRTGQQVTARFVNPPTYSERGSIGYEANVSLEIMP